MHTIFSRMLNATTDAPQKADFHSLSPGSNVFTRNVFTRTVTPVTPKAAESTYVKLAIPRIKSMDSISNHGDTTKEQLHQVLATACVIAAGSLFVAPFLVVVAGFALVLLG